MQHFTIRDIENLTGIKAHTLRVWEQRYGLHLCKRKKSLHRYYDNEDLKQLLRIAWLCYHGYRISQIACLGREEIRALACHKQATEEEYIIITRLTEAAIDCDSRRFEKLLDSGFRNMGLEEAMARLVYPFMNKLGLLWMTDDVLPAQEHLCSCIIQQKIIAAIDRLKTPLPSPTGHCIVLFTPEGENHEIPLLLAQYIFKKNGHPTVLLGRNTSLDTLRYFCGHHPASHLYFHLITNFTCREPAEYLELLREQLPGKKIIAAGPAFKEGDAAPGEVQFLRSIKEMITFAISSAPHSPRHRPG